MRATPSNAQQTRLVTELARIPVVAAPLLLEIKTRPSARARLFSLSGATIRSVRELASVSARTLAFLKLPAHVLCLFERKVAPVAALCFPLSRRPFAIPVLVPVVKVVTSAATATATVRRLEAASIPVRYSTQR